MKSVVNMLFHSTIVFLIVNQISISLCLPTSSRNQSHQCSQHPSIRNPRTCCDIPPVFSKGDFEFCNSTDNFQKNATGGLTDCTKQLCIFKTLNFIMDGDRIDRDALYRFMDVWAEVNPDFEPITRVGKVRCLGQEIPGSHKVCEVNRFVSCMANVSIMMCPKWNIKDKDCKLLKNHVDTCAKYFSQ